MSINFESAMISQHEKIIQEQLKLSRGIDFVQCGYFSYKLDAFIQMELKTKKFYLQNSEKLSWVIQMPCV